MKKLLILIIAFSLLWAGDFKNYSHSFFGVYGKRASVMGRADGSALEVWIYPYKVFHGLKFMVFVDGAEQNPYSRILKYRFSHLSFKRIYGGDTWKIEEEIYPDYRKPMVYLVYRVSSLKGIEMEFSFRPDLSPMWPACLGGKFTYWDDKGYFLLSEAKWKNFAFVGFPEGKKEGKLPAHKLPGGRLKYRIALGKGEHIFVIPITAEAGKYEKIEKYFRGNRNKYAESLEERRATIEKFLKTHLRIKTPEAGFNNALKWAVLNLNFAFVENQMLGEGLVAGYGLSGKGERPGFAWYFGGDGVINSLAVLDYGDFDGVKKEIEFLFKYQREDGKIPHEISQGAGFVNWFKDYGFPYFHGDTTLYFAILLDEYFKRSGDLKTLKKHSLGIKKIMRWMMKCDSDKDGIVETQLAGAGASETGPLRQKMKTDILLAGLSIKAWEALKNIWKALGMKNNEVSSEKYFRRAKEKFQEMFWDDDEGYYDYAVKKKGKIREITIWPAIPMRFSVVGKARGRKAASLISSPWLSSDWGTRFLSSRSKYYDPVSYNNGVVWPFLTGFASLALYKYGNPYHGLSLLRANVNIFRDFDYLSAEELLSGETYRPLDQAVPNQIWSSGTTVSAFVEGLLGFKADASKKEIDLSPRIPLHWEHLKAENLRIGKGTVELNYFRKDNLLKFLIKAYNLKGYNLNFAPEISAVKKQINLDHKPVKKIGSQEFKLEIDYEIFSFAYPFIKPNPEPGDFSTTPIIQDFELKKEGFNLWLWGKGKGRVFIFTDREISCPEAEIVSSGKIKGIIMHFGNNWKNREISCHFKN